MQLHKNEKEYPSFLLPHFIFKNFVIHFIIFCKTLQCLTTMNTFISKHKLLNYQQQSFGEDGHTSRLSACSQIWSPQNAWCCSAPLVGWRCLARRLISKIVLVSYNFDLVCYLRNRTNITTKFYKIFKILSGMVVGSFDMNENAAVVSLMTIHVS